MRSSPNTTALNYAKCEHYSYTQLMALLALLGCDRVQCMVPCVCATLEIHCQGWCGCLVDTSIGSSVFYRQNGLLFNGNLYSLQFTRLLCPSIAMCSNHHPLLPAIAYLFSPQTTPLTEHKLPYSNSVHLVPQYVDMLYL